MKATITIAFFLSLFACSSDTVKSSRHIRIKNTELTKVLAAYYRENLSGAKGVVMVDMFNKFSYVKGKHDTTTFFVYSTLALGSVLDNPPIFYSTIDYGPVLFYTGAENICYADSAYENDLTKLLHSYLYDDLVTKVGENGDTLINLPPNYNPVVWKIDMVSDKVVNRKILN